MFCVTERHIVPFRHSYGKLNGTTKTNLTRVWPRNFTVLQTAAESLNLVAQALLSTRHCGSRTRRSYCQAYLSHALTISVAERCKARVCGHRSLELRVRIPPVAWMSVSCECRVLAGRGLCMGRFLVQRNLVDCSMPLFVI